MIDWRKLTELTPQDVADALGVPVLPVELVWEQLDPIGTLRAIRGQYVAAVWDGTSPLNTWTPEQVRDAFNPPRYGQIVYVYRQDDGKILDLQPTMPGTADPIVKAQAQDVADSIADQRALNDAVPQLYADAHRILSHIAANLVESQFPNGAPADTFLDLTRLLNGAGEDTPDGTRN